MGIAAAAAISGCATVYQVSESGTAPLQLPQNGATMRKPSVSVSASPVDEASGRLAASVQSEVEGVMVMRGFDVMANPAADSVVSLAVSRREAASLADWRVYEGTVEARVTEASSGKLVARSSFSGAGERAQDESKAESGLKEKLVTQVTAWLAKVLSAKPVPVPPGPPAPRLSAATLTIGPARRSDDPIAVLRVQRRFMDAVAQYDGVVSCSPLLPSLGAAESRSQTFSFRVVYDQSKFAFGLLNTIVMDEPFIGDNIKIEISR